MKAKIQFVFLIYCCFSCQQEEWTLLIDRNMSKWDNYLSYKHRLGYNGSVPVDSLGNEILPIGLNHDTLGVFTIIEEDGEPVIRVSGEYYGCLISKREYENYHLRLQVKWGNKKWPPRELLLKDAGILYHSVGSMGAEYWRSWMLSQEFQIMEGHMGDYWSQATSAIDIRAYQPEHVMNPVADVNQPFLSMGQNQEIGGYCMRSANYEKPVGQWNTLDLICYKGKSIHIVNGEITMVLKDSRYIDKGQVIALVRGKIQLQSEASEVYYKDVKIKELNSLPIVYQQLF
ncbi:DUF1080 domain-containing protein [Reichenbachiella agarivorans]|uniref:DUF1080 domain-containing protein n=1 Tax=Reichenbachiella agarivorans TaxID=2979464 RepID=A0ABY6CP31_9BACT|nr:DUF1080 domain-containing protein [Reichenbachiella agarivorans]UXP32272.1 DUF1080 domain-containing protein [Reichenbachiella agarivorans]